MKEAIRELEEYCDTLGKLIDELEESLEEVEDMYSKSEEYIKIIYNI